MGLMDKRQQLLAEKEAIRDGGREASAEIRAACPGGHFVTEVNRGSINMSVWQRHLNDMYEKGYRLQHVLEQDGNTVQVFEHYFH